MIFIDTNIFVYAVGRPHQHQHDARDFLIRAKRDQVAMFTSVEVLQELMHVLFAVDRSYEFDAAMNILTRYGIEVLPLELEDIQLARKLRDHHPNLSARDLCHLASCKRNDIEDLITFDAALSRAFYST